MDVDVERTTHVDIPPAPPQELHLQPYYDENDITEAEMLQNNPIAAPAEAPEAKTTTAKIHKGISQKQKIHKHRKHAPYVANTQNSEINANPKLPTKKDHLPKTLVVDIPRPLKHGRTGQVPLINDDPRNQHKRPSMYIREKALSMVERLTEAACSKQAHPRIVELIMQPPAVAAKDISTAPTSPTKFCDIPFDQPLFEPFPPEVILQSYQPFNVYEILIIFRNNDKVARKLTIEPIDMPYFSISGLKTTSLNSGRVAPGMEVTYVLKFCPEETCDYNYNLVCITEREKFLIPVRAVGARAVLDFPDEIAYSDCPVRYKTTKTLLVRNIGTNAAKFTVDAKAPFVAEPQLAYLEVGSSMQIDVDFEPEKTGSYSQEMRIEYDTGEQMFVRLMGTAEDINVRLEKSTIRMTNTYITMSSSNKVKIFNRSNILAKYEWKMFPTDAEEQQFRARRSLELACEEQKLKKMAELGDGDVDIALIEQTYKNRKRAIDLDPHLFSSDTFILEPISGIIWPNSFVEVNVLFRPHIVGNHTRTVYCEVSGRETRLPLTVKGEAVGPKPKFNVEMLGLDDVLVNTTHQYQIILENKGDIDVEYQLANRDPTPPSMVGASIPQTQGTTTFTFVPSDGVLPPGKEQVIDITFSSGTLGDFAREFVWNVKGSPSPVLLLCKGRVVGPTFRFDADDLDFGRVSYGFSNDRTLILENTSHIEMWYVVRIPPRTSTNKNHTSASQPTNKNRRKIRGWHDRDVGDEDDSEWDEQAPSTANTSGLLATTYPNAPYEEEEYEEEEDAEFIVTPSRGLLLPQQSQELKITFKPGSISRYETEMVLDIVSVGVGLGRVKLKGESLVPNIQLKTPLLDYGDCFLTHEYTKPVEILNDTAFRARYHLLQQDESAKAVYAYSSPNARGVIEPRSRRLIDVNIRVNRLGQVNFPVFIYIEGMEETPLVVDIVAQGIGPNVVLSTREVNWGKVLVLRSVPATIRLQNDSPIRAPFTCSTVSEYSAFHVEPSYGVITPHGSTELTVTAFLDDSLKFTDILKIAIQSDGVHEVQLVARGQGTTIVFDDEVRVRNVDFGDVFTNWGCKREFVLWNKGRRTQTLYWVAEERRGGRFANAVAVGGNSVSAGSSEQGMASSTHIIATASPIFEVVPSRIVLKPGAQQMIVIKGQSTRAGLCHETLLCQSTIEKDPTRRVILESKVSAHFIDPLLDVSPSSLKFVSIHTREGDAETLLRKELVLRNVSTLPLQFSLRCERPYSIEDMQPEYSLSPTDSVTLTIVFDPSHYRTRISCKEHAKLTISYKDHPQRDSVDLYSDVSFPNLVFSETNVAFGCIPMDEERKMVLSVTNAGALSACFEWSFLSESILVEVEDDDENMSEGDEDDVDENAEAGSVGERGEDVEAGAAATSSSTPLHLEGKKGKRSRKPQINIDHIYDIVPSQGIVQPGETLQVQVTFFGYFRGTFSVVAVCDVVGGPKYEVLLRGNASPVAFTVDKSSLDFGTTCYQDISEQELTITNTAQVEFEYSTILLPSSNLSEKLLVTPATGSIGPHGKQKITVRFCPLVPETVDDMFLLQIAHFEPVRVRVTGAGTFPRIVPNVPRIEDETYKTVVAKVTAASASAVVPFGGIMVGNAVAGVKSQSQPQRSSDSTGAGAGLNRKPGTTGTGASGAPKANGGTASNTKIDPEMEAEIERSVLCDKNRKFLTKLGEELKAKTPLIPRNKMMGSVILAQKMQQKTATGAGARAGEVGGVGGGIASSLNSGSKRVVGTLGESSQVLLAKYLCDFGHVIRSTSKRRTFRVTNRSSHSVTFQVDRASLVGTGFSIEPEKVKALPGAPNFESVEFQVTFQARNQSSETGTVEIDLPINVNGGPTVVVTLKAEITVPELQLSTYDCSFGEVLCGHRKILWVLFQNPKAVPCEWTAQHFEPSAASTKAERQAMQSLLYMGGTTHKSPQARKMAVMVHGKEFEVVPNSGTLQPGGKMLVSVRFAPTEDKEHDLVLPIKVNMNPKSTNIRLTATGVKPMILFQPSNLVLGPILPCSEGVEGHVQILNPTNYPVEVYSVDFDEQYLEEEEIARQLDGYENGLTYVPPRTPGMPVPEFVVVEYGGQKVRIEKRSAASVGVNGKDLFSATGENLITMAKSTPIGDNSDPPDNPVATGIGFNSAAGGGMNSGRRTAGTASSNSASGETGSASGPNSNNSDPPTPISIIIHGPPFSGRTTQALKLSQVFGNVYIRVDELVEGHLGPDNTSTPQRNNAVPLNTGPMPTIRSKESVRANVASTQASGNPNLPSNVAGANPEPLTPLPDVEENESHHFSNRNSVQNEQAEQYDNFDSHIILPEDMLADIFRARLQKEDCVRGGVVVDGLDSKYAHTPLTVLRALLRASNDKRKWFFINLSMDVSHIREREMTSIRLLGDRDMDIMVREVSEEEYDNMAEQEKEQYDDAVIRARKKMKELIDRRKLERKLWEEDMANRLGVQKAEDESRLAGMKKRHSKRMPAPKPATLPPPPVHLDKPDKTAPSPVVKNELKGSKMSFGSVSPRFTKKGGSDRLEASPSKLAERLEKLNSGEKSDVETMSSRLTLSDAGESFYNDLTFRRFEQYSMTLEPILTLLREGEKPLNTVRPPPPSANAEKKSSRKQANIVPAEVSASNATVSMEAEQHPSEENSALSIHDVNGSVDEESLFKAISDVLPSRPKLEEAAPPSDMIPPPIVEQIVFYPNDRAGMRKTSSMFTLYALAPSADADDDGTMHETGPASNTVANVPQPPAKSESGKKSRGSNKVAEEVKAPEPEEEPDKESKGNPFRWVLQPNERKELVVKFASSHVGKFEKILTFEITGLRSQFTFNCLGVCQYSQIASDYRKVYPRWRKTKDEQTIVHGEYVIATNTFEFGPLLYTKPKEKYLERFPENRAIFNITNTSHGDIKLHFTLKHDVKGDVFFFDPPHMDLAQGQTQTLSVWAYPRSAGHFEDMIICCIRDNPEPYIFRISCVGVKPELEIDKKFLSFEKMLLGRREVREIKLRNGTLMPVAWKLAQIDSLGEEFQISPTEGQLDSFQECVFTATFHALKPVVVKRVVRLEISDTEKIAGVAAEIPILVTAEAYDIAMDLHFPKGYDGLDFGVLKVFEEAKQLCTLKNKGKYEVGYKFLFENKEFSELFTVSPQQGIIPPSDKPFPIQVVFKTGKEMAIRDIPGLKCQFYEPQNGEVTATIPIKLCARAVFSKFSILPVREVNFGALVHGTKAARQLTIENSGEFDFRYSIFKIIQGTSDSKTGGKLRTTSRPSKNGRATSPPTARMMNRRELVKQADAVNFGAFTVFPTSGLCPAGTKQPITVEFHPEVPGSFDEIMALDISDRSPNDNQDVIEYRLLGESCIPGINTTDLVSIFEEQAVIKRLELFNNQANVYGEEDRAFHFGAYLAGQQAQVRFKLSNPYKIPCDVSVYTKPRTKGKADVADFAFDVEPKKLSIPSHEYRYVTVTFHPTSIQSYAGVFEAVVENVGESKSKTLSFELRGEGTLPRIFVEKPVPRTKQGYPLLKFKRLLVGASQTLPITIKNEGVIPAKLKMEWLSGGGDEIDCESTNVIHILKTQEIRTFEVRCRPLQAHKIDAELKIRVIDNPFEDTTVSISGEGYLDDITFDNLNTDTENEVNVGYCFLGEIKQSAFTVTNHCGDHMRIAWTPNADFVLSPTITHLKPFSSKETTVIFTPKQQIELTKVPVACKISKIRYTGLTPDDWDDRMTFNRWNSSDISGPKISSLPEPAYESIGAAFERSLLFSGFADYSNYDCPVNEISFKSTMMFQSRVYRFPIRNVGKVPLRFNFAFFDEDGQPVDPQKDQYPYSVSPMNGSIEAGDQVNVTVRFAPMEEGDFSGQTLVGLIPNLVKDNKPIVIKLNGVSLRPICHFELEDSDYITSERRNLDTSTNTGVPASLDPNVRIIEFSSCGIRVRNTRRFYIVNPTHAAYEFEWICDAGDEGSIFRCLTPKGVVQAGRKFEMVFEFTPETVEIKESLWRFTIAVHGITVPFLLVGQTSEPNVYMDRTSVNFRALLVGRQLKETVKLINNENIPFSFAFADTSCELNNDGTPVVKFSPTSGTIGPNSEVPIEIAFTPSAEKVFNFNLVCNVRKKSVPLTINVKGEGYEIREALQSELGDHTAFELAAGPSAENVLDFGEVQIKEKRIKRVTIINSGKFNFDFSWKLISKVSGGIITIYPDIGTVNKGERIVCEVAFLPTSAVTFKGSKAVCQIVNGRSYPVTIMGVGCRPALKLSKTTHDFGSQFVFRPGMSPATTTVRVTNEDVREISFDVLFPESNAFDVQKGPNILAPGEFTDIGITFYPREAREYKEVMKLEINGLSTMDINLIGEGVDFKVDLVNPENRTINLGAVRVGHCTFRNVKIVNRSSIPATFTLGPPSTLETFSFYSLTFSHRGECTLRPKGTLSLDIKFNPLHRIPFFSEEVFLEAPGISKPLFVVTGACQGIEIKLENDTLPFGAVVQKSFTTRRIQLQNIGDIGAKFKWDTIKFAPDFSITPSEGYISPGMDIPLEITFHPSEINPDIRYENLCCTIEGTQPLYLTLTGMCVPQPLQNEVVKFSTPVRQTDVKSISLSNKTSTTWHIKPIIENEYWTGPEVIDVEPGQTKSYDIAFTPLETTGDGEGGRHEGSIFFPLPDGSGMLYKLFGTADKPLPSATITREIPCKTQYTEVLPIKNWLKRAQRFKVTMEVAKPDPSIILKGHDFIDVPALLTKEYKLGFYSFKEGVTNAKVIFKNEQTQEFIFFALSFKSTPPGVIGTLDMNTVVRQLVTKDIVLSNPLQVPVTFNATSNNSEVNVTHSFSLQPRAEGVCLVEFLPLLPRESTARITITSPELGTYQYDLRLTATPAGPERSLHLKVGLGGNQVQTFRFLSYSKVKTEYSCKVDHPDFTVEKSVVAPSATTGGVEVCVDVFYEPSKLGDVRTQLLVSSPVGGDYVCPLYGHCVPPRPQGPIAIKQGQSASVPFKNVFTTGSTFNFFVDNPAFTVKAQEAIGSKKTVTMTIAFRGASASNSGSGSGGKEGKESKEGGGKNSVSSYAAASSPQMSSLSASNPPAKVGRLTVTHAPTNVSWIYYLQGMQN